MAFAPEALIVMSPNGIVARIYLKVTGSSVENPRRPRQSRLKAIFEVKMK
jgi:hypothetical protein